MLPTQRYAHENYGPSAGHRFIRGQWVFDDDWLPIQEQRTSKSSRMFSKVGGLVMFAGGGTRYAGWACFLFTVI